MGAASKICAIGELCPYDLYQSKNYAPPAKQFEYEIQLAGIQREMYKFLLMTVCHQQKK